MGQELELQAAKGEEKKEGVVCVTQGVGAKQRPKKKKEKKDNAKMLRRYKKK